MNLSFLIAVIIGMALFNLSSLSWATPSTTFWTPCSTYLQPFAVPHLTYDSYFGRASDFPTDLGLTIGLLPWDKFQAEAGFDLFLPGEFPAQFNFKAGFPEDALFRYSPGLNAGMFGIGTQRGVTNYNIVYVNLGHAVPPLGSLSAGLYLGTTRDLMESAEGEDQSRGWMLAYYRTLEPLTDRLALTADWMSGENIYGAGGVGMYLWFTPRIDLILGWVWFNETDLNPYPNGLFTIQLDVDVDFARFLAKPPGAERGASGL